MRSCLTAMFVAACALSPASAQVVNGGFESGGTGWQVSGNLNVSFPATGGNPGGYARLDNGTSSGIGTIGQSFACGAQGPGLCEITFSYRLTHIGGFLCCGQLIVSLGTDANILFSTTQPTQGWETTSVWVPCGTHILQLQLYQPADIYFTTWETCFDNVSALCTPPVPAGPSTWGLVKKRFAS